MYEGLFEVLTCARKQGIVPSHTTNGALLTAETVRRLESAGMARINISWNGPGGDDSARRSVVAQALQLLLDSRIQVGVNVLVTPALLPDLSHALAQLRALGVRRTTILRPKPAASLVGADPTWYEVHRLHRTDLLRLHAVLGAWQGEILPPCVNWLAKTRAAYRAADREAKWLASRRDRRTRHGRKYKLRVGLLDALG